MSAELRRLLAEATPGPWRVSPGSFPSDDGGFTSDDESYTATVLADNDRDLDAETVLVAACWAGDEGRESDADADAIAALRNETPALLDELDALRAVAEAARSLLAVNDGPHHSTTDHVMDVALVTPALRQALTRLEETTRG